MNHYYTNDEQLAHHYETFSFPLCGLDMQFTTDNGVFSKRTIDFGTRVLLEAMSQANLPQGKWLDMGCGYGPIGLTLAKLFNEEVDMVDVNERALDLARCNARLNHVSNQVTIFSSSIYQNVTCQQYSGIVTNPPIRAGKDVVHQMIAGAFDHLQPQGELWVVIQKKQGAPSAEKRMKAVFGNCETVTKKKGYFILKSCKN